MANQAQIFVSHHHSAVEDIFTTRLVADLESAGADVWVDDARITSDDFIQKINEGLSGRQWLVLVMTPAALKSPWVQAEVNAALNQVRKGRMFGVVPIVALPCDDVDIPPLLDALHRYDATSAYEPARDGLLRALNLALPATSTPPAYQATPPPSTESSLVREPAMSLAELGHDALVATSATDIVESTQVLDTGIEVAPPSLAAWFRKGKACLESQHFEEALTAFERALALDGNSALAWSGKAMALKQLGRYEEAGFAARCAQLGAVLARRRAEGI